MCEMLGISARRRIRVNDILREFFSHGDQHPHGWGLARFSETGAPSRGAEASGSRDFYRLSFLDADLVIRASC